MPGASFQVWNLQEKVYHYRVPVWDRLVERGRDDYRLTVIGPNDCGRAFGGAEGRPYLRDIPLIIRRPLGQPLNTWPTLRAIVERERPDLVLVNPNPRTRECWTLPDQVHGYGGVVAGWTKVHSYSGMPRWMLRRLKRRLLARYDLMAVYGQAAREELLGLGYPDDRVHVAQNTIDTDEVFEREAELAGRARSLRREHGLEGRRVLLYVGQMARKKRVRDLLEAWPALRRRHEGLSLVLVGHGATLSGLRRRAARLDPDGIRVIGQVPEGDDYAWIAAADCTVQCGAIGLAINQSMALGRPTVVADEHGSDSEIVAQGVTGWRYPKGDIPALISSLHEVLDNPEAAAAIAARGRERIRSYASIDNLVDVLDQVIRRGKKLQAER